MKDMVITIDEAARCRMKYLDTNDKKRRFMFDAEWHAEVWQASLIVGQLLRIVRIRPLTPSPARHLRVLYFDDQEARRG